MMILLLGAGAVCTVRTKAVQLLLPRFLFMHIKERHSRNKEQFRTVCTSLGAAMGTGNITGVSTALATGGPGAVFWMWISAFLGMALVFTENRLSAIYSRGKAKGTLGYIRYGLGSKTLAAVFAVSCCGAAGGMGGMGQVSSASEAVRRCCDIPSWGIAIGSFILVYAVISGGGQRIRYIAQLLLPAVSVIYAIICICCILRFRRNIFSSLQSIFSSAFGLRQAAGGLLGHTLSTTISVGLRRGIFSNEAGLGSSAMLHSCSESENSTDQGMWGMFEVFVDTFVCCSLTALAVLCAAPDMEILTVFTSVTGIYAPLVLAVILSVFALCTVIGWYYCGEMAFSYLTADKWKKAAAFVFSAAASLGALVSVPAVWSLSDIFNGLMAFPNLTAVLFVRTDKNSK